MTADGAIRTEIANSLRNAPEARLRAVIAAIDRHPRRAEVEDLVELVRPRIAGLHIPRPLTPQRALVVPFEGLLCAGEAAPRDALRLPRSVLPPLFALVRERIDPAALAEGERLAEGRRADDTLAVMAVGRRLWPGAVDALAAFHDDPRGIGRALAAAGHDAQLLGRSLGSILPLLRLGEAIAAAMLPRNGVALDPTLPTAPHRHLLLGCVQRDPGLFRLIAASMLFHSEFPESVTRIIRDIAAKLDRPGVFSVVAEVAEALKADLLEPVDGPGLAAERRGQAAMRLVTIVSVLEGMPRFDALAIEAGRILGGQFTATVRDSVIAPLAALAREGAVEADAVRALETAAHAAKRIEAAGRLAGATASFKGALAAAREPVGMLMRAAAAAPKGGIGRAEIARLAEILLGPDEAMALLEQAA
ncbi:hypothetical protein [Elioraea sp.]|uniref:hypothetical protein n=1 Tax=Elioraea sp. TaxID=2185103 RepID=UPI003F6ED307